MVVTRRNSVAALRRVSLVSVAAAAACFLLANCAIPAANAQVSPSADTFASTGTPILNYGSAPLLIVTAGTNTYIRFDLTSIPANSTVNKATLVLFVDAVTGNGAINVYKLTNSWAENTLNELNAPALAPPRLVEVLSPSPALPFSNSSRSISPAWCSSGSTAAARTTASRWLWRDRPEASASTAKRTHSPATSRSW